MSCPDGAIATAAKSKKQKLAFPVEQEFSTLLLGPRARRASMMAVQRPVYNFSSGDEHRHVARDGTLRPLSYANAPVDRNSCDVPKTETSTVADRFRIEDDGGSSRVDLRA